MVLCPGGLVPLSQRFHNIHLTFWKQNYFHQKFISNINGKFSERRRKYIQQLTLSFIQLRVLFLSVSFCFCVFLERCIRLCKKLDTNNRWKHFLHSFNWPLGVVPTSLSRFASAIGCEVKPLQATAIVGGGKNVYQQEWEHRTSLDVARVYMSKKVCQFILFHKKSVNEDEEINLELVKKQLITRYHHHHTVLGYSQHKPILCHLTTETLSAYFAHNIQ